MKASPGGEIATSGGGPHELKIARWNLLSICGITNAAQDLWIDVIGKGANGTVSHEKHGDTDMR